MKRKAIISICAVLVCCLMAVLFTGAANIEGADIDVTLGESGPLPDISISINAPSGWRTKETSISVRVVDANDTGKIKMVEAKIEKNGKWEDITDDMKVSISENCTVYIQVTDTDGNVYSKNRYIECFDRTKPTIKARIDGNSLRVEADDDLSGVAFIYVNGHEFTEEDMVNDTLTVRIREYADDFDTISVYAVDSAGNKSNTVSIKNPYYKADTTSGNSSNTTQNNDSSTSSTEEAKETTSAAAVPESTGNSTAAGSGSGAAASGQGAASASDGSVTPVDGNGTVLENSTKTPEEREFFTIETVNGGIFFIVVDKEKTSNNVYLLTMADEDDLTHFIEVVEDDTVTTESDDIPDAALPQTELPEDDNPIEIILPELTVTDPEQGGELSEGDATGNSSDNEPEPDKKKSGGGMVLLIILVLGVGGAGYYFKIVKPKKDLDDAEDIEDFDFAEDDTGDYEEFDGNSEGYDENSEE